MDDSISKKFSDECFKNIPKVTGTYHNEFLASTFRMETMVKAILEAKLSYVNMVDSVKKLQETFVYAEEHLLLKRCSSVYVDDEKLRKMQVEVTGYLFALDCALKVLGVV